MGDSAYEKATWPTARVFSGKWKSFQKKVLILQHDKISTNLQRIKKYILLLIASLLPLLSLSASTADSLKEGSKGIKALTGIKRVLQKFTETDTNYIEPQKYNFTVMLQETNTLEIYTLKNLAGSEVTFSPRSSAKFGPYVGYRWVFLGYTFNLNRLSSSKKKTEVDFSIYAPQLGVDLFYRDLGNEYRIRRIKLAGGIDTSPLKNVTFDGMSGKISGFNIYYIFNHHKFSYPAAFSQSTIQRRSAGSVMAGIGYMRHSLDIDAESFHDLLESRLHRQLDISGIDTTKSYNRVRYKDFSLSGGYGYNWVFARNCLLAVSLSVAVAYKHSWSEVEERSFAFKDFSFKNLNLDGIGRFGLVYNNMRWYAGASAVFHTYYYKKQQFSTNTTFGNVNIYIGFNFGRRK